jgi:hypothetical protein
MRSIQWLALTASLSLVPLACGGPVEIDDHPCPPGGTTLTYEGFGKPFVDGHCQSCHASRSADRQGAPGEVHFDTREDVQRQRARIFVRAASTNTSMPPGPDDPPDGERDALADWLACGAP